MASNSKFALDLPEAEERETWDQPTFRIRNKIFATLWLEGGIVTVKASVEDQHALIESDPETFGVASHVGRFGWTTVRMKNVKDAEVKELLTEAWLRTAPKTLVKQSNLK